MLSQTLSRLTLAAATTLLAGLMLTSCGGDTDGSGGCTPGTLGCDSTIGSTQPIWDTTDPSQLPASSTVANICTATDEKHFIRAYLMRHHGGRMRESEIKARVADKLARVAAIDVAIRERDATLAGKGTSRLAPANGEAPQLLVAAAADDLVDEGGIGALEELLRQQQRPRRHGGGAYPGRRDEGERLSSCTSAPGTDAVRIESRCRPRLGRS